MCFPTGTSDQIVVEASCAQRQAWIDALTVVLGFYCDRYTPTKRELRKLLIALKDIERKPSAFNRFIDQEIGA